MWMGDYTQKCMYLELLFIYILNYLKVKIIKLFFLYLPLMRKKSQVNKAMREINFQCILEIQHRIIPISNICIPKSNS